MQPGEAQVRGFDFEAKTSPIKDLDVIASYSYLDSKLTESNAEAELGQPLSATPKLIAALWLFHTFQEGELVPGFGFGGGVRYRGDYYSSLAAGHPIDDVTLFDAALSYDFSKMDPKLNGLTLALKVNNLFDEEFLVSAQDRSEWSCAVKQGLAAPTVALSTEPWRHRLRVISRFGASIVGGYAFAYGFVALATLIGFGLGLYFSESRTLAWMLAFIVYLVAMLWAFSARSVTQVWIVLAGGGAAMGVTAWAVSRWMT